MCAEPSFFTQAYSGDAPACEAGTSVASSSAPIAPSRTDPHRVVCVDIVCFLLCPFVGRSGGMPALTADPAASDEPPLASGLILPPASDPFERTSTRRDRQEARCGRTPTPCCALDA